MAKTFIKKTRTGNNASYTMTLAHDYSDKEHAEMLQLHGPVEVEMGGSVAAIVKPVSPYSSVTVGYGLYDDAIGTTLLGTLVYDDGTHLVVTMQSGVTFSPADQFYVGPIGVGPYTGPYVVDEYTNGYALPSREVYFPDNFPLDQSFTYENELSYQTAVNKAEAWGIWGCALIALALQARWTNTKDLEFESYDTIEIEST